MRAREEIHAGIPDEESVAALKVLQRMIHNVGGTAWHAWGPAAAPGRPTPLSENPYTLLSESFAANPRKSTPAAEVAPAESRLRRRKAAARRVPPKISVER
ncbi:hypothetical protein GA0115244_116864 [Streptomyces sp. DvalAA-19]|nr:hypothetical protein GA0115244_116864 [Streptomyces sp. DvalAA-19]